MAAQNNQPPYISSDKSIPEFTFQALLLGIILSVILGAANVYLGLYAGMTVSASIPAAVISMAILRGLLRRGTILENNMVQTIASSGEALAAGVIFTIPALVITEAWHQFHFWPTTFIAATGGLLGILFMIPLRRALIIEEPELSYPEGVACAEVLKAGDQGGQDGKTILAAILTGGIYKFLSAGLGFLKQGSEVAWRGWGSVFYFGTETSLALMSVGYIVGLNIAALIFLGGAIGWIIGLPLYAAWAGVGEGSALETAWTLWSTKIRYVGVGAMTLGGLWTIYNCRAGMQKGLKKIFGSQPGGAEAIRTDKDLRRRILLPMLLITTLLVFGLYYYLTRQVALSVTATVLMVIASFFFVAVAAYIVGMVGSSNSPVSGMTICSLLFASAVLLLFGVKGTVGVIAVLGIAGVVCCAVCSSGDICQDLKTGYLVGATPRKQQIGEIIGTIVPAFCFAPILTILHGAYGIGMPVREGIKPLAAPQAVLFSKLAEAFFLDKGELPWNMFWAGVAVAAVIILADQMLKARNTSFRLHIMAVAVGIYLPLMLSTPILIGGILHHLIKMQLKSRPEEEQKQRQQKGILIASGLIAGEALVGILVAAMIFGGMELPLKTGLAGLPESAMPAFFLLVCFGFWRWVLRKKAA